MALRQAIIQAVDNHGTQIAQQQGFYSILADYGAFRDERETVRRIVRGIIKDDTFGKAVSGKTRPAKAVRKITKVVSAEGYDKEEVHRLAATIFSALNLLTPDEEKELLPQEQAAGDDYGQDAAQSAPGDISRPSSKPKPKPGSGPKPKPGASPKPKPGQKRQPGKDKPFIEAVGETYIRHRRIRRLKIASAIVVPCAVAIGLAIFFYSRHNGQSDKVFWQDRSYNVGYLEDGKTVKVRKKAALDAARAEIAAKARWCDARITPEGEVELIWDQNPLDREREATITVSDAHFRGTYHIMQYEYGKKGMGRRLLKIVLWIVGIGIVVGGVVAIIEEILE